MKFFQFFNRKENVLMEKNILIEGIPFYSQHLDASNFKSEGFSTLTEAEHWSSRICGLACVKMTVAGFIGQIVPLHELLQIGLRLNAYRQDIGWIHQGLIEIAKQYGLDGGRESIGQDLNQIYLHLAAGRAVVASVSPGLEGGKAYPRKDGEQYIVPRGGHLVVLYGANIVDARIQTFILHHPSSEKEYEWPALTITLDDFLKSFSNKGNIMFISKR